MDLKRGKQRKMKRIKQDRISSLPDGILHHILSFLDLIYVVRTSVLSKRWASLWKSLQFLNFNSHTFENIIQTRVDMEFDDYVDHMLAFRDDDCHINTFQLDCKFDDLPGSFESWIIYAVEHNVQELDLTISTPDTVKFPDCLFVCESLVKLKLNLRIDCDDGDEYDELPHDVNLPKSIKLPRLKTLVVNSVCFYEQELTSKLFSSPVLESLTVENCVIESLRSLVIDAPKLKHLAIASYLGNDDFEDEDRIPDGCKIEINAPNLASFVCNDFIFNEHHLHNCANLEKAELGLQVMEYYESEKKVEVGNKHLPVNKELYDQRFRSCLERVTGVKELKLSAHLFEFVSEPTTVFDRLPTPFYNLRHLELETFLSKDCISAIIHLLKISPGVEGLVLQLTRVSHKEHPTYPLWAEEQIAELSLDHLKSIQIKLALGCTNELELLRIFVETASIIEKMVVTYHGQKKMTNFKKKLLSFPRASPSLSISFTKPFCGKLVDLMI